MSDQYHFNIGPYAFNLNRDMNAPTVTMRQDLVSDQDEADVMLEYDRREEAQRADMEFEDECREDKQDWDRKQSDYL